MVASYQDGIAHVELGLRREKIGHVGLDGKFFRKLEKMDMTDRNVEVCSIFIQGKWVTAETERTEAVYNPSDGNIIARTPMCGSREVDMAVRSAQAALPDWSETPVVERARLMFRYVHLLEKHFEELSQLVTREHGKTLEESRGSVRRGIEVVEFACGAPSMLMGDSMEQIASGIDCDTIRQPVGVCAGITPFNFPACYLSYGYIYRVTLTCRWAKVL